MRIHLLLGEVMGHGGIQRYNRQLVRAAGDVATDTRVYALNDEPHLPEISGFARDRTSFIQSALADARRERPDAVLLGHVNFAPVALAYRAVSPGTRTYVVTHGKEVESPLPRASRAALRACTGVLAVSESTRSLLISAQRVPWEKVAILHYGFNPSPVPPAPTTGDPSRRGPVLLSVSRLDEQDCYKGIDTTLEAMASLKHHYPDMRYVVVGNGTDRPRLIDLAARSGVAERVAFEGSVSDARLQELYRECDIFVLPSTHEGLGIVYLEAMVHGKPVIGVRAGGVADAIVHEMNGLLVQHKSAASVAAAIFRLSADEPLRRRLGAWGQRHTVPAFSVERMEARLAQILSAGDRDASETAA